MQKKFAIKISFKNSGRKVRKVQDAASLLTVKDIFQTHLFTSVDFYVLTFYYSKITAYSYSRYLLLWFRFVILSRKCFKIFIYIKMLETDFFLNHSSFPVWIGKVNKTLPNYEVNYNLFQTRWRLLVQYVH